MDRLWIRTHVEGKGHINRFRRNELKKYVDDAHGGVDFGLLLPMPEGFRKDFENRYISEIASFADEEAQWRFGTWGCNWNGTDVKWEFTSEGFTLTFDTVDKCPLGWLESFAEWVFNEFGVEITGIYAPNKFGCTEEGSFIFADKIWTTFDVNEAGFGDNDYVIKRLWELRDEDLLYWRGFAEERKLTEEEEERFAELHYRKHFGLPLTPRPSTSRRTVESETPYTETPNIDRAKRGLRSVLEHLIASWW